MKAINYLLPVALLCSTSATAFAQNHANHIEFNGVDQCVKVPSHEDFNINSDESFSITCWVNVKELINGQRFVSRRKMSETTQTTGYEMWGGSSSTQYYAVNTPKAGGGNIFSDWCSGNGTTNTWMHLAMVINRADNSVRIYRDGTEGNYEINSEMTSWSVVNNYDLYIGAGFNATANAPENYMKGKIADVRIWSKALTSQEITDDMTASVDENTANLIAAYDFQNIKGLTVPDLSGNGHNGTLIGFAPVGGDSQIYSVTANADSNFTGRGNTNEIASSARVVVSGDNDYNFGNIKFDLTGTTDITDVKSIKVYMTADNNFDTRDVSNATLLGSCTPTEVNAECTLEGSSTAGSKYLWITFDVADEAKEGNKIAIKATEIDGTAVTNETTASREILLGRKLLFAPGDYNSVAYRIPVLTTAWDGSLIAITDKRKYNQGDIPEDIDIVVRRSTDNGKTWSEPVTMAQGTGVKHGFGDAAIVKTNTENELLCIFIGGNGLFASSKYDRIKTYISRSQDNGQTWSEPQEITDQIFSGERANWTASFCAAGNGLKTRNGVLMFVAAMRHDSSSTLYNHVVYSNDNGQTWNVSNCAMVGGDESKVVELNDGRILMSIRRQSKGARYYTISNNVPSPTEEVDWTEKNVYTVDSWSDLIEPACNGDIVRYTSTKDGFDKDRILHTVPNHSSSRENVTLFLSYDEAKTWGIKKTICKTGSAYSSIAILEDGTIGVYVEENYNTNSYSTYFLNVSLDWLTDGADQYTEPSGMESVATPKFSLEEGYYNEEQTLEMTTETDGASIHYTLDGTTPTKESTVYEAPLKLNQTVTVKAIAMKEGMSNSAMTTATYTFLTEWEKPEGTVHNEEDRYVTSATTTGAVSDLNYSLSSKPSTVFIDTEAEFTVEQGQQVTLRIQCTDNMKWCHAVLFADWNRDFDFNDEGETLDRIGKEAFEDVNLYKEGNTMLKDFEVTLNIPADAKAAETRLRVQFTDAWHKKDNPGHTHTALDYIDKGGCYDFVMHIQEKATAETAKLNFNNPENGSIEVRYEGETELLENDADVTIGSRLEITLIPENDYEIKSLLINGTDKTAELSDNKMTVEVTEDGVNIEASFNKTTAINGNEIATITVRPTLFEDVIFINANGEGTVQFFSVAGQLLQTTEIVGGENSINTSALPHGSMILVVKTDKGSKNFNVIRL